MTRDVEKDILFMLREFRASHDGEEPTERVKTLITWAVQNRDAVYQQLKDTAPFNLDCITVPSWLPTEDGDMLLGRELRSENTSSR